MELREYAAEDFLLNDSFIRYCLQSDIRDVQFWENWIQNNPEKQNETTEARNLLFALGLRLTPEEKKQEFEKLKKLIGESIAKEKQTEQAENPPTIEMPARHNLFRWLGAAAAACLVFLAGYSLQWFTSIKKLNKVTAYEIYRTSAGERKTLELADGSTLVLNSNSILKIPSDFNDDKRTLHLTGEAYFEAAKNKNKPFTVFAKNISVQALGTSFKISSYDFNKAMRVSLIEGQVKVESKIKSNTYSETLLPGEEVTIEPATGKMNQAEFDVDREIKWKEDRLLFKDASLQQIAAQLEYWYGLKVNLYVTAPRKIRFNGEFINKDINRVLAAITYVNKLSYSLNENGIIIFSK